MLTSPRVIWVIPVTVTIAGIVAVAASLAFGVAWGLVIGLPPNGAGLLAGSLMFRTTLIALIVVLLSCPVAVVWFLVAKFVRMTRREVINEHARRHRSTLTSR